MKSKISIVLAASAALAIACGGKSKRVLADGSSTVYPITAAAAEEFQKVNAGVHVTVGISGTGGGFKKFCNNETDVSNASRYIKEEEISACKGKNIEFVELPVAYDGLAIVVSKANTFVSEITVEELKKIFQRENPAKTWKDVNPAYPAEPLKLFSPGQDSGTFDYFAEEIVKKKDLFRQEGVSFSEDDNALVTGVAGNKGALGFFGIAYYENNKDKLKLVAVVNPKTKKAIQPSLTTVMDGSYAPLSRPIFIYVKKASLAKENVAKFAEYYLQNAAKFSKETGYIPLPEDIYTKAKARVKGAVTGSVVKSKEDKHKPLKDLF